MGRTNLYFCSVYFAHFETLSPPPPLSGFYEVNFSNLSCELYWTKCFCTTYMCEKCKCILFQLWFYLLWSCHFKKFFVQADVVSISSMTQILSTLGSRLRLLSLAGNKLKGAPILKSLVVITLISMIFFRNIMTQKQRTIYDQPNS